MRLLAALAAVSLVLAGCGDDGADAPAASAPATDEVAEGFDLQLTGVAEVPGPGDEEGTGTADVILDEGEACVEVEVSLGVPPEGMHIHEGTVDEAGPVVIGFGAPTREDGWSTCAEADQALLDEIAANPADYYLNVHNAEFPEGAVRAQLG